MRRFVVRSGDRTLAELLEGAEIDSTAVRDGRVFVGRERTLDPHFALRTGDEVFVANGHDDSVEPTLLGSHHDLFAFLKPAGLPSIPDRRGNASVLHSAARVLGVAPADLHVLTRLDTNVSGVVLIARGNDATRRGVALQAERGLMRRYLGLSLAVPSPPVGIWDRPIPTKGPTRSGTRGDRAARTGYEVVAEGDGVVGGSPVLLAFRPVTGRTHQIRIHAAEAGSPLLGDTAYGGAPRVVLRTGAVLDVPRVALHAGRVELVSKGAVVWRVDAPHPDDLVALWRQLGGNASSFDTARSLPMEPAGD